MNGDVTNHTFSITSFSSMMDFLNSSSTGLTPFNQTVDSLHSNETVTQSYPPLLSVDKEDGLSTRVTIAIAFGSVVVVIIITFAIVCFVWKKYKEKKKKSWVDNLTLSYIADSNADLTKTREDQGLFGKGLHQD